MNNDDNAAIPSGENIPNRMKARLDHGEEMRAQELMTTKGKSNLWQAAGAAAWVAVIFAFIPFVLAMIFVARFFLANMP